MLATSSKRLAVGRRPDDPFGAARAAAARDALLTPSAAGATICG
jgi:hypothetical protein